MISKYRESRAAFVREVLGAEPDPWQAEALAALDRGQSLAVKSGHGVGKTAFLAWTVLHGLACFPDSKIPCTAPTQHQLADLLWPEIRRWAYGAGLDEAFDFQASRIAAIGRPEWYAAARSCAKPESLAGFHAPTLIYVVDEASGVPDSIFQAAEGALTGPGSQLVMCGNPTQKCGFFYRAFQEKAGFCNMTVSSLSSGRVAPAFAENIAARWGKESDVYRVRVLGEFPAQEENGFFAPSLLRRAVHEWNGEPGGAVQLGIDVARFGNDKTVFCRRQGDEVLLLKDARGLSVPRTAAQALEIIRTWKPSRVLVDDTGVGGGVTDLLRENTDTRITGVNFGGAGSEYYANTAALMAGCLRDRLSRGACRLPDDPELFEQLSSRRYSITATGKLLLERKEEMKARGLSSPDKSDAVFLAFYEPRGSFISMSEAYGNEYPEAYQKKYW